MTALPEGFTLHRGYWEKYRLPSLDWEQPTIRMFGRTVNVPRLTKWYGKAYTYSGIVNAAEPMEMWLAHLCERVQDTAGARFNSALLNYYRGGSDSVAWHSDDEPELGAEPTIASLSIGARRVFKIRRKSDGETWSVELGDGDLLIMRGPSQRDYQHAVPKTLKLVGHRANITFRLIEA